jgi:hypothetical protein
MVRLLVLDRIDRVESQASSPSATKIRARADERATPLTSEVELVDADGAALSWVGHLSALGDGRHMLDEIDAPDALLRYYFGRGGRQIMVSLTGGMLKGHLETRWDGDGRRWWLELTESQRPV